MLDNGVTPQVATSVLWYKVVRIGENPLTAAFLVDSPFTAKYGGYATPSNPVGRVGVNGAPSSPYTGCDGSTGDAADPRKYYVYPLGTTWKTGNAATDAWSPGTGCNTPCPECAKGTVMPLWIPSNSDAAVTSTLSLADGALPRSCALSVDIMHPSCAITNVAGCTVACQYPYQNGDGGTQMRGVALSPSVCTYPNENFRA